jgi:putative flippase GtrA
MELVRRGVNFFLTRLFALYIVFAGIATIVDFAVLTLLVEKAGMHYLTSAAISYLCGMTINFSLNKFFNFRNKSTRVAHQFGLFAFVALIGLALNQIILYLMVDILGIYYLTGKVVSVAVVMFWSFIGHKKITFSVLK